MCENVVYLKTSPSLSFIFFYVSSHPRLGFFDGIFNFLWYNLACGWNRRKLLRSGTFYQFIIAFDVIKLILLLRAQCHISVIYIWTLSIWLRVESLSMLAIHSIEMCAIFASTCTAVAFVEFRIVFSLLISFYMKSTNSIHGMYICNCFHIESPDVLTQKNPGPNIW